jgi:CBS domain containing-hemolysin-like protein
MSETAAALDGFGVAWRLGATLFFVVLNGFFVAAEFALVKVRAARIETLAEQGGSAAGGVRHILEHLDLYLSACQLGITFASLALGALGEPAVSVLLVAATRAAKLPIDPDAAWLPVVSIGLAFLVITTLHMTLGEQAPKMLALQRAEGTALRTAGPLRAFTWLFRPFIGAVNALSNAMLRAGGLSSELGEESGHTAEEIRSILSLSARAGHISDREQQIAGNVFRMMELEVRHIVVPRVDVEYLTVSGDLERNLGVVRQSRHSRFPLCEVGLDTIIGFVHAKDVLQASLAGEAVDLRAVAREALFVTDTMALSELLRSLQAGSQHCAAVVDEHGTVIGLAFLEDALEEIVGPLGDEFDRSEPEFTVLPDGSFELAGRLSLPDVCHRLDLELEAEDETEDTIGGLVTAMLGRLPRKGDVVRIGPYQATVVDASRRRVQKLRMAVDGIPSESSR